MGDITMFFYPVSKFAAFMMVQYVSHVLESCMCTFRND